MVHQLINQLSLHFGLQFFPSKQIQQLSPSPSAAMGHLAVRVAATRHAAAATQRPAGGGVAVPATAGGSDGKVKTCLGRC